MEKLIKDLLGKLGENPEREGLVDTPKRVKESFEFLTQGYHLDIDKVINGAVYDEDCDDMVIVKNIEFFSLCEHHMLPFFGRCHIGYLPSGKVIGVSKIARIVDMFARRLQIQERLSKEIASAINDAISPRGVGIVMEAQHMCMTMRGVEKQHSVMTTSAMLGFFRKSSPTRNEFLNLIRG